MTLTKTDPLSEARDLVAHDLAAVNELITRELTSDVSLIQTITQHIVQSGGKRLRSLMVLLSAKACGYQQPTEHIELATVIEFIHTATLLHDDVIDKSEMRRGQQTANAIWDNQASVLVGDFLYSRAFQILARRNNIPVMKILANTTNELSEGEVLQLINQHKTTLNETQYYEVIRRKTAQLFSATTEIGALLAQPQNQSLNKNMAAFGLHLGMAYQIIDDLLDYTVDSETMGKNLGDDLREGKMTLPLIYALTKTTSSETDFIHQAIHTGAINALQEMMTILNRYSAFLYTKQQAIVQAQRAKYHLTTLPPSNYREALEHLLTFIVDRNY